MLAVFTILLLFQCLGEGIVFLLYLPIPGPVAGMLLLMAALLAWPPLGKHIEQAANTLLSNLSLLFVPVMFSIIDGVRRRLLGLTRRIFKGRGPAAEPQPAE